MQQVAIDKYRIVSAPLTGIGWVAVQQWDADMAKYRHVLTLRSRIEAEKFISSNS